MRSDGAWIGVQYIALAWGESFMADERQKGTVSRSEFYRALLVTWLYILLLVSSQLTEQANTKNYVLFAGALIMFLGTLFQVFRLNKAGNTDGV
jgi:hypothetical protein